MICLLIPVWLQSLLIPAPSSGQWMAHARRLAARDRLVVLQVVPEELGQFIERDEVHPVVQIHVAGTRDNDQFFGLAGQPVSLFAELSGMGVLTRDEQHRTRGNRPDVVEGVEVHELDVACQRGVGRQLRRAARRRVSAPRRAVEIIELALNRVGIGGQLMARPAGVFRLAACEFGIALLAAAAMICFRCSTLSEWCSALRLAAPMSYMLTVAIAFMRGSIFAALMTKLPLPQIPRTPIRSRSTNGRVPRKSTAALKSSA